MGHGLLRWNVKPNITTVARVLTYVTGLVNQELLLKNEYLLAEKLHPESPSAATAPAVPPRENDAC